MVDRKDREDSRVIQQSTEINIPMVPLWGLLLALAKPLLLLWYDSGSDVTQHSYIDLDQKDMETYLGSTSDLDQSQKYLRVRVHKSAVEYINLPQNAQIM